MEDGSRPLSGVGSSRSSSPAKSPQFFKIINPLSVQHKKLALPKKFFSTYGKNLGTLVHLKVPTGAVWEVELVKSNDVACLCKGWEEFAKYYSIRLWHFLVFRYEGNSTFHVIIFDMSASEIEYPFNPTNSIQISRCFNKNFNLHIANREGTSMVSSGKMLGNKCFYPTEHDMGMVAAPEDLKPLVLPVNHPASSKHKIDSLKKSIGFKSKYPHCAVFMQPSYVSHKQTLNIPTGFGRKYFGKQSREVLLKMSGSSRTWSVKCHCSARKYRLYWVSFVRENKIKAADVCVFELIESNEPVFNVTIFRASAMV